MKSIILTILMMAATAQAGLLDAYWARSGAAASTDPWTPSNTVTALWLDGAQYKDGGATGIVATSWTDYSGNSRNATNAVAQAPKGYAVGNLGYVNYDVAQDTYHKLPNTAMPISNVTVYVYLGIVDNAATKVILGRAYNYGAFYVYLNATEQLAIAVNSTSLVSPQIATTGIAEFQYSGTSMTIWINGVLSTNLPASLGNPNYNASDRASVGCFLSTADATSGGLVSGVREIIMTHSVDSVDTRQKTEGYLAWRWGITNTLPAGHPYKTTRPTQ